MRKPNTFDGYDHQVTDDCEQVLVTLLNGMGPWKESVYLIGGLAPRYIIKARPPQVPAHAGTGDIDLVVDMAILADTEAYHTLETNLERMGFSRVPTGQGGFYNWRWQVVTDRGTNIILEFLASDPNLKGGGVRELPSKGKVSAVNIPGADLVFPFHSEHRVTADLLGGEGRATETLRYANLVSFTCLKAFALDHRGERKDAHDLVYCVENYEGGTGAAGAEFTAALKTEHAVVIQRGLKIIISRFCDTPEGKGNEKDGPVKAARFENPEEDDEGRARADRVRRQRDISATMMDFIRSIPFSAD